MATSEKITQLIEILAKYDDKDIDKAIGSLKRLETQTKHTDKATSSANMTFAQQREKLGKLTGVIGQVAASFTAGFAASAGLAKRAGVDFTLALDALNKSLDWMAQKYDAGWNKTLAWVTNKIATATEFYGLASKETVQTMRDTAAGFEMNIAANAANRQRQIDAQSKKVDELGGKVKKLKEEIEETTQELELGRAGEGVSGNKYLAQAGKQGSDLATINQAEIDAILAQEAERNAKESQLAAERMARAQQESDEKIAIAQQEAAVRAQLAEMETQQAISVAKGVVGLAEQMFGESKETAIASAVINTYEGATKAMSQGGIYGAALAAIVIAAGMAQVHKIMNTEPGSGGVSTGGGMGSGSGARFSAGQGAADAASRYGAPMGGGTTQPDYTQGMQFGHGGAAAYAARNGTSGGGGVVINVNAPALTAETSKAAIRELRKVNQVIEAKKTGGRVRGRL